MVNDHPRSGLLIAIIAALGLLAGACAPVSRAPQADSTTISRSPPFDIEAFLASKLEGAFGEMGDRVGVVVLVPEGADVDFESILSETSLHELEGFMYVPADDVTAAADQFAASNTMEPLEGRWVAYGLIPRFADSPTAEWVKLITRFPEVLAIQLGFRPSTHQLPEGWRVVADLPFGISGGAIVDAVEAGVVVIQAGATYLIEFDGSLNTGDAPPLSIPESCCGGVSGFSTGSSLVLVDEIFATWILDVDTLTWNQADPRPVAEYVLGTAMIEGELFVVNAASRSGDSISSVAVLDLDTGTWSELESVPSPISVGGVTTDGDRLIVAGTQQGPNNNIIGERTPLAYSYTQDEGWHNSPISR